jgi:hypothetical protein
MRRAAGLGVMGVVCAVVLAGASASASDFVDTRVTFVFSDDNVLAGPGETLINSPDPDFGPREGNFFPFENLNTRDSGQETLTHLVLYGRYPGFSYRLLTEAAVVIRANLFGNGQVGLRDDGSYLRLAWGFDRPHAYDDENGDLVFDRPERTLALTAFPFTSERFRLGYQFDLSWGGQGLFTELRNEPVPAVRLQFSDTWGYAFTGFKTTRQLQALENPQEVGNNELAAFYGVMGGFGLELGDVAMWEVNGGFFQSGHNRKPDVVGANVDAYGVSTRLSVFSGLRPGTSIDFRLYQNTPEFADAFLRSAPAYAERFSWLLSLEASYLAQTLGDPDVVGGTTTQPAIAAALNFDTSIGHLDTQVDVVYRDLAFVLFNVPSLDPLNAFPESSEQDPEILAAVSAQYHFEGPRLTPGILIGMQIPAAYRGLLPTLPAPPEVSTGQQTVVVRNARDLEPLPPGQDIVPIYSIKATLRWDLSPLISIMTQVLYSRDQNQTRLVDNEFGFATRVCRDRYTSPSGCPRPDILGFAILTQARF